MSSTSLIKGGHAKEAASRPGSSSMAVAARRQVRNNLATTGGFQRPFQRVRLLSIISAMIFIALLSRGCAARPFLGQDADGYADSDRQSPLVAYGAETLDIRAALAGCKNLAEAVLSSQMGGSRAASLEMVDFGPMDGERAKRLSPKHTPRFGR